MQRKFFSSSYKLQKKETTPKKNINFQCRCCKKEFRSQGRFINKGGQYIEYCSDCRKICYMCSCRHGGKGNACSKFCSDRYKKLRWVWKLKSKKALSTLDRHLREFKLEAIDTDILKEVLGKETIYIQQRSKAISKSMLSLQHKFKIISEDEKLIVNDHHWIDKNTFYIYNPNMARIKIEDLKLSPNL